MFHVDPVVWLTVAGCGWYLGHAIVYRLADHLGWSTRTEKRR